MPPPLDQPAPTADDAMDHLRRHSTAVLAHDERYTPVRYVLDPEGHPVIDGSSAILKSPTTVLFIPAEEEDGMEALVTPEPIDSESPEADRWRIYHGRTDQPHFIRLIIDAAKWRRAVFDADEFLRPNPLAEAEAGLCRWMNTEHRESLRDICRRFNRVDVHDPVMVGIDPGGLDIRATFGIVRIVTLRPMSDESEARQVLARLLAGLRGGRVE
jgi:hypothetical protein